ncbi:LamG-like jellyroll fold domain-containing protein [Nanoarchaeota archaeon]
MKKTYLLSLLLITTLFTALFAAIAAAQISNTLPTLTQPILNSSYGSDSSSEDLIVSYEITDLDYDTTSAIINWELNGQSITVLNLPFESHSDDETVTTWDYSGYGNNGSVVNAVWNPAGDRNRWGAYELDGKGVGIIVPEVGLPDYFGEVTVMAWVNFGAKDFAGAGDWRVKNQIVAQRTGLFTLVQQGSGSLLFRIWNETNFNDLSVGNDISTPLGWQHVAATYSAGVMTIYVDGVEINSNTIAFTGDIGKSGNTADLTLLSAGVDNSVLNGSLDDMRIYDIALSAEQINAIASGNDDVIVSQETTIRDIWKACITPNDGYEDGVEMCSNELTIIDTLPEVSMPVLTSTYGMNNPEDDLLLDYDISDADGDNTKGIVNWFKDGVSNTLLYLPFEVDSGNELTIAKDYSDFGNNCDVNGAAWNPTSGIDGFGAYEFDGNKDYMNISASDSLNTNSFSLSMWFKIDEFQDPYMGILTKLNSTGKMGWRIYVKNSTNRVVHVNAHNGTTGSGHINSPVLNEDQWYHLVLAYDAESQTETLYFDGVVVGTKSSITTMMNDVANNMIFGNLHNRYFNGVIDDVRMHGYSLSPQQVRNLFTKDDLSIAKEETVVTTAWSACVTPTDGFELGAEECSNEVIVSRGFAEVSSISLSSSSGTNTADEDLSVSYTVTDPDYDDGLGIVNWYKNGESLSVLNLPFERGSTETFTGDYSGYDNNGKVINAVWNKTRGHDGNGAYSFDGVNGSIVVSDSYELKYFDELTIAAWVDFGKKNLNGEWQNDNQLIARRPSTFILTHENETVLFRALNESGASINLNGINSITGQGYQHVVATYKNGELKLYENGVLINQTTWEYTGKLGYSKKDRNISIGGQGRYLNTSVLNGSISELLIYQKALSFEQIQALYQGQNDLIVSQETSVDDEWRACVTPNSMLGDGMESCSNTITILDTPISPPQPSVPGVYLNSPSDGSSITDMQTLDFNFRVIDPDDQTLSCSIYLDSQLNQSNSAVQNNTDTYFTIDNIAYGDHTWKVTCDDGSGAINSETWSFSTSQTHTPSTNGTIADVMNRTSKLEITDITFRINGKKDSDVDETGGKAKDVKPGDEIEVTVEVENFYDEDVLDLTIEDVEIQWNAEDMDDGKNLDEEEDLGDLDAEENDEVTFTFEVPIDADEDDYEISIKAVGEDEDNKDHSDLVNVYFEVDKDKHDLEITEADLNYDKICKGSNYLQIDIVNIGKEDEEDASLRVYNDALGIDEAISFDVDEGDDVSRSVNFFIEDALEGVYEILLELDYDKETETQNIEFVVDCTTQSQSDTSYDDGYDDSTQTLTQQQEEVELIMLGSSAGTDYSATSPGQQAYATTSVFKKQSALEEEPFIAILLVIVIFGGLAAVFGVWKLTKGM